MRKLLTVILLLSGFIGVAQVTQVAQVATVTQMKNYNGSAGKVFVSTGNNQGEYYICPSCTANEATVFAGAGGKKWARPIVGEINATWFATGDGTTDDHVGLAAAIAYARDNKQILRIKGSFSLGSSTLSISGTDIRIMGEPGAELKTSADKVFNVSGSLTNVYIDNVQLTSTGSSGTVYGLFTSDNQNIDGLYFNRVIFRAVAATTNGFKNINATTNRSKRIYFNQCRFVGIGQMGIEFQNHDYDGTYRYSDVFITNCVFDSLGLNSTYGMAVSCSGRGQNVHINNNNIKRAKNVGIELAGSIKGANISDNILDSLVTGCAPFSFTNGIVGTGSDWEFENVTLANNVSTSDGRVNLYRLRNSYVLGNTFVFTGTSGYVQLKDWSYSTFTSKVITPAQYAVFCTSTAPSVFNGNYIIGSTLNNAASALNSATIQMDGVGTSGNIISANSIRKGTGGFYFAETNSAAANFFQNYYDNDVDLLDYQLVSMSDADYTLTKQNEIAKYIRFNGTLTATRTINMPSGKMGNITVLNNTAQTLSFTLGVGTATVAAGVSAVLSLDGSNPRVISTNPVTAAQISAGNFGAGAYTFTKTASDAIAALTINQAGTGSIVEWLSGGTLVANIDVNGKLVLPRTTVSGTLLTMGTGTTAGWNWDNGGNPTTRILVKGYSGSVENIRFDPASSSWTLNSFGAGTNAPTSRLHTTSFATAIVAKTAAYTATISDGTITGDGTGGAFNITLPSAIGISGRIYRVKKIDASANAVTVATTSSQTIDGATTYGLGTQWKYVTVQSDNANWIIIGNN